MAGLRALQGRLHLPVEIHELDADVATQIPGAPTGWLFRWAFYIT
jgi:hypothetical protein